MTFLPEMTSPQSKDEHRCVDTEQKESLRLGTLRFFEWFGTGNLTLRSRLLQYQVLSSPMLFDCLLAASTISYSRESSTQRFSDSTLPVSMSVQI